MSGGPTLRGRRVRAVGAGPSGSVRQRDSYQPVAQSRFGSHALSKSPGQGLDGAADQGHFGVCATGWYQAVAQSLRLLSVQPTGLLQPLAWSFFKQDGGGCLVGKQS